MRTVSCPCTGGEFSGILLRHGFPLPVERILQGSCPAPNTVWRHSDMHATFVRTDANNCGTCGNSCNGGSCVGGKCDCSTAAGLTLCGTTCVNLQTDPNNCGACGNKCSGLTTCQGGKCTCAGNQTWGSLSLSCVGCDAPLVGIYSASLNNIPAGQDPIATCHCTPGPPGTPINGRLPDSCTQQTILGLIGLSTTGSWRVPAVTQCSQQAQGCGGTVSTLPPPAKPGCWFNGTACYGVIQECNYCCTDAPSYTEQCGNCIGYWQAPSCYTPPP